MNLEAINSFLDVAETGSFSLSAERAGVSQSTVSARIQALETTLGVILLRRSRMGIELTSAGVEFRSHAARIVETWHQARLQVALPANFKTVFRLGVPFALQESITLRWIAWMKQMEPEVALHIDAGTSEALCDRLSARTLDAAVMYMPQRRPGLNIEPLLEEALVLVQHRDIEGKWSDNLVHIDWGEEFSIGYRAAFPDAAPPSIKVGPSAFGLRYVLSFKGAAYLPESLVADHMKAGNLVPVADAPRFRQPVYLVTSQQRSEDELHQATIAGLRLAAVES